MCYWRVDPLRARMTLFLLFSLLLMTRAFERIPFLVDINVLLFFIFF
jgi:hypothetical protein